MTPNQYPLQQIGIIGDRCDSAERWRVELAVTEEDGRARFEFLHDEKSVGTFARVHRGQLRQGGFVLPLAVKIQRAEALSGEKVASVKAKFDAERLAYLRVQEHARREGDESPVVRLHDLGTEVGGHYAADFPCCVVCRHAKHALQPRCPKGCGPLQPPDSGGSRVLRCPACHAEYGPAAEKDIVSATVRHDPACDGCGKADADCAASALMPAFFPGRVLLFDLLDLDLEEFLVGRAGHPGFWKSYGDARRGAAELAELLDLFGQLVGGVERLHGLDVVHYDLKPRNVCLNLEGGRLRARLIDLGFADAPREQAFLQGIQGVRVLETEYSAPEMHRPLSRPYRATFDEPWCVLPSVLDVSELIDPPAVAGDLLDIFLPGQNAPVGSASIAEVVSEPPRLRLRLDAVPPLPRAAEYEVQILKQTGPAADVFSLGMILLVLLTREVRQAATVRNSLLAQWVQALTEHPGDLTSRNLVLHLRSLTALAAGSFRQLDRALDRFGPPLRPIAEGLMALALRMVVRHPDASWQTLLKSRGDGAEALPAVREELEWAAARLRAARLRGDLEADRLLLDEAGDAVRKRMPVPRPGEKPGPEPAYDEARLDGVLRAGPKWLAGREEGQLFAAYRGRATLLSDHLRRLAQAATPKPGAAAGAAPSPQDVRALLNVLRFAVHLPEHADVVSELTRRVQGGRDQADLTWLDHATWLTSHQRRCQEAASDVERTVKAIAELFLERADAERAGGPGPLTFTLGRNLRQLVGEEKALASIAQLRRSGDWAQRTHDLLVVRWDESLRGWQGLPTVYRDALDPYKEAALSELNHLREAQVSWRTAFMASLASLDAGLNQVKSALLGPWDHAARPSWIGRLSPIALPVTFTLDAAAALPTAAKLRGDVAVIGRQPLGPSARSLARLLIEEHREASGRG